MATAPIGPESRSVIARSRAHEPRLDALALALSNRDVIEQFVLAAIDMLDLLDGSPDDELDGDEMDGSGAEDDFRDHNCPLHLIGPGCPVSDPDMSVDDGGCDDINDDREEEEILVPAYGVDQTAGMEPTYPAADRSAMKPHIERIRATRCDAKRIRTWGGPDLVEYKMRGAGDHPRADA